MDAENKGELKLIMFYFSWTQTIWGFFISYLDRNNKEGRKKSERGTSIIDARIELDNNWAPTNGFEEISWSFSGSWCFLYSTHFISTHQMNNSLLLSDATGCDRRRGVLLRR